MFDVQLDTMEVVQESSYYCGNCAVEMEGIGHNTVGCPICNNRFHIEPEQDHII